MRFSLNIAVKKHQHGTLGLVCTHRGSHCSQHHTTITIIYFTTDPYFSTHWHTSPTLLTLISARHRYIGWAPLIHIWWPTKASSLGLMTPLILMAVSLTLAHPYVASCSPHTWAARRSYRYKYNNKPMPWIGAALVVGPRPPTCSSHRCSAHVLSWVSCRSKPSIKETNIFLFPVALVLSFGSLEVCTSVGLGLVIYKK